MQELLVSNDRSPLGPGSAGHVPPISSSAAFRSDGSAQHKTVRFGSLEAAHFTLTKLCVLPAIVVTTLALWMLFFGRPLSSEFYALGLIAFLISARIFTPLDLRSSNDAALERQRVFRLILEWSCVVAILVFLCMSFKLTHVFPRLALICWSVTTPAALWLANLLAIRGVQRFALDRPAVTRFVIIGVNDVGLELSRRIQQSGSVATFCGFFDQRQPERLAGLASPVTAGCTAAEVARFVGRNAIDRVYIALPMSTAPRIQELLNELRDTTASIYFVPNLFAFDLVQARCVAINGMPAFSICDSPLQGVSAIWKRLLDLTLAWIALVLLLPVFLATAIAVKYSSVGPVLFKQRRYGLNGEEILIYKFRSMTVCEDGEAIAQATRQDHRFTPIGAFLRRTSLDELPQILNVIQGKMSFVGPRPHAVAHNEEYRKLINGYMIRHKVRPGITGWAQVNGSRGETSTVDLMQTRVHYDIDYLRNWSLALDLKIIYRTARTVLSDPAAC